MLPIDWRQVRPEGPRTRLKPMTAGDGRVGKLRRFHRTGADRSLREVGCQDLPFFTSEFRFCQNMSYFMLDFMERKHIPCSDSAIPCFYHQIERIYIEDCSLRTPLLDRPWEGAGEEPDTCCSWPAPMTDRRAWWLLSPAPGWVEGEQVAV